MPNGLLYNINSGKVERSLFTSIKEFETVDSTDDTDLEIIVGEGADNTHYVDISGDPHTIEAKTTLSADFDVTSIAADGIDVATLSSLPIPCTVYVDENSYIVDDGIFELTAIAAGEYLVWVDEIQYLKKEWTINAS